MLLNLFVAFSSSTSDTPNYIILEEHNLPEVLQETSGLYCPEVGSVFTINDSGNKSIIYNVDHTGHIMNEKIVAAKNKDWEALTGDDEYFYIGDIGNNNGKRQFVQIYVVPKQGNNNESDMTSIKVSYINNSVKRNEYLDHDFDSEALINVN